jgi:membrane protease YdiL (CAAX protease family)
LIYQQLKLKLGLKHALILSSLCFGAWHWIILQHFFTPFYAVTIAMLIALGGVLFALLYERSGSLLPAILVHGLGADFPIILIFYWALERVQGFGS